MKLLQQDTLEVFSNCPLGWDLNIFHERKENELFFHLTALIFFFFFFVFNLLLLGATSSFPHSHPQQLNTLLCLFPPFKKHEQLLTTVANGSPVFKSSRPLKNLVLGGKKYSYPFFLGKVTVPFRTLTTTVPGSEGKFCGYPFSLGGGILFRF